MSRADADLRRNDPGHTIWLWIGVLLPPAAILLQLEVNYAILRWACREQWIWPLHLISALALVLTVSAGVLAWRMQRGPASVSSPREGFMATVGMLSSVLFSLVGIAQWIPLLVHGPCDR